MSRDSNTVRLSYTPVFSVGGACLWGKKDKEEYLSFWCVYVMSKLVILRKKTCSFHHIFKRQCGVSNAIDKENDNTNLLYLDK